MCNRLQMKIIQGPRLNLRHLILFDIGNCWVETNWRDLESTGNMNSIDNTTKAQETQRGINKFCVSVYSVATMHLTYNS